MTLAVDAPLNCTFSFHFIYLFLQMPTIEPTDPLWARLLFAYPQSCVSKQYINYEKKGQR